MELGGLVKGEVLILGVYKLQRLAVRALVVRGVLALTLMEGDDVLALTEFVVKEELELIALVGGELLMLTTFIVGGVATLFRTEVGGPARPGIDLVMLLVHAKASIGGPVKDLVTWSLISAMSRGFVGSTMSLGFRLVGLREVWTPVICLDRGWFLSI